MGLQINVQIKGWSRIFRQGDTLVITRLDRLARSTLHLCQMADIFQGQRVDLQVIGQNIYLSLLIRQGPAN